ncbi:hypothetical protein ABIE50_004352 [Chitinophaga sp. OAE865]
MQLFKIIAIDYVSGNDRSQIHFFALEEMVSQDSWLRVIDLFVDLLPLKDLGFKHTLLQKEGRPHYDLFGSDAHYCAQLRVYSHF